jgi:hypothetical protein
VAHAPERSPAGQDLSYINCHEVLSARIGRRAGTPIGMAAAVDAER